MTSILLCWAIGWLPVMVTAAGDGRTDDGDNVLFAFDDHAIPWKDNLRLTLLRSPVYCHETLIQNFDPNVRHEHIDLGRHDCCFALLPIFAGRRGDASPARLTEISQALADPIGVVTTDANPGDLPGRDAWLRVEPKTVALTTLKPADDGKGVVARLWETSGRAAKATIHWMGQKIAVAVPANAIRTVRLTRRRGRWQKEFVNGIEQPET